MFPKVNAGFVVAAACVAAFLPGALIFGFPGVMGHYWQQTFHVGRADIGQILFYVLVAVGIHMFVIGRLQEKMGPGRIMAVSFLVAGGAYFLLPFAGSIFTWSVLAACVGFAFGTLFAVSAPFVSDCFGMEHFGSILGLVFTAFGFVSGVLGPWLGGYLLDATQGNFMLVFFYLGSLMLLSSLMIWITTPYTECTL